MANVLIMSRSPTRRRLLAGLGTATAGALAGCAQRLWPGTQDGPRQVALSIKTTPAQDDPIAAMIVSQLEESLRAAGVDAVREPMEQSELYRDVLVEREYEIFVSRYPDLDDVDGLRSMLHSQFVGEQGWQNPFGFSDPTVDEYLEAQLSETGERRRQTLAELFEYLLDTAPYTAIAFPDRLAAAASDFGLERPPRRPTDFLELLNARPNDEPLRIGTFRLSSTDRLNPITVDATNAALILDLLYDPLVRHTDEGLMPWLAETISWRDPAVSGGRLVATVELHDELRWHDGTSLDATDVGFTFEFLGDTALGEAEGNVPSLRYRGRESLVDDVTVLDARTVEVEFYGPTRTVAERALTVPILPEHVWEPRSELVGDLWTEALTVDNEAPIGSGPFSFVDASSDLIELEPFDEHVLRTGGVPGYDSPDPVTNSLEFHLSPGPGAVIEGLLEGTVDLTADWLTPEDVEPVETEPNVSVLHDQTRSFYIVGYNVHQPQLGNPNFRRVVSQLVDREHVVDEIFSGHAQPATTPSSLVGVKEDEADELVDSIVPSFPGSDGVVDEEQVRSRFEDAGYRYENGDLMA